MGKDGHGKVKIDFDHHRGRYQVEMEEINLFRDCFFNQPASGIFVNNLFHLKICIIGDDDGRFDFAMTGNGNLTDIFIVTFEKNLRD